MSDGRIYGVFVLILTIVYILFINSLPFPQDYKVILYLPSILMFALFLFLIIGKKTLEEKSVSEYFNI